MPIQRKSTEAEAPAEPHLALLVGHDSQWIPIRPGSSLWVIEDRKEKIFPFVLKRVSHKQIVFEMADGNGNMTEYRFQLTTGKPLTLQALKRMRANNPDAKVQR